MTIIEKINFFISKHWLRPYLVLVILVFMGYGTGLKNGYALDDHFVTTPQNKQVSQGVSAIPDIFTTTYGLSNGEGYGYRPLVEASYALEYELFGWNITMSHLINILLMFMMTALLFSCIKSLISEWQIFWCLLLAALFALHPIHNEVVNNLKNRDELFMGILGLSSLRLFLFHFSSKALWPLVLAILLYALGYFAKISIVPFTFFIPLTLFIFSKCNWKKSLMILLVLVVAGKLANSLGHVLLGQMAGRNLDWIENPMGAESSLVQIINAPYYFLLYLKLHLWPHPLLSYYGLYTVEMQSIESPLPYVGFIIGFVLLVMALFNFERRPVLSWGLLSFLLFLSPYLNFPLLAPGLMAERFASMSVLGFVVCLVFLFRQLSLRKFKFISLLAFFFIGAYLIMNNLRNPDWHNLTTLLKTDVAKAPASIKLNTVYAEHLHATYKAEKKTNRKAEKVKLAARHYLKAIELYPEHAGAYENLGILCIEVEQYNNAIRNFRKAIKYGRDSVQSYFLLGVAYEQMGDSQSAYKLYKKATRLDSFHTEAHNRMILLEKNF